jgi:hypothetical protein
MDGILFRSALAILTAAMVIGCSAPVQESESIEEPPSVILDSVAAILDSIHQEDQRYRNLLQPLTEAGYTFDSDTVQQVYARMVRTDSSNMVIVDQILDEYGWLGIDEIGYRANSAIFLVIQHAPHEVQKEYLPAMREAVANGKAAGSSLALLEDRVALGNGEPQIYGSQIVTLHKTNETFVEPIANPDSVNQRRAEVGLGPIEDYVERFGITWDLEAHKERSAKWLEVLRERVN